MLLGVLPVPKYSHNQHKFSPKNISLLIFQMETRNILYKGETGCLWNYTMGNV